MESITTISMLNLDFSLHNVNLQINCHKFENESNTKVRPSKCKFRILLPRPLNISFRSLFSRKFCVIEQYSNFAW
jgi:hypothetical protein